MRRCCHHAEGSGKSDRYGTSLCPGEIWVPWRRCLGVTNEKAKVRELRVRGKQDCLRDVEDLEDLKGTFGEQQESTAYGSTEFCLVHAKAIAVAHKEMNHS